jgi:hypothetical protein
LPGVDANDPHKTYATLTFYFSMCSDGRWYQRLISLLQ